MSVITLWEREDGLHADGVGIHQGEAGEIAAADSVPVLLVAQLQDEMLRDGAERVFEILFQAGLGGSPDLFAGQGGVDALDRAAHPLFHGQRRAGDGKGHRSEQLKIKLKIRHGRIPFSHMRFSYYHIRGKESTPDRPPGTRKDRLERPVLSCFVRGGRNKEIGRKKESKSVVSGIRGVP